MAKEVTNAVEFRDPIQPAVGADRHLFVVACGDGSIYEFQKMSDDRTWTLRSRGSRDEPVRDWTQRRAPLPSDVSETLDDVFGKKFWQK